MKSIRRVLFVALLAVTSSIANAELISNIPLDSSRYELMDLATLTHYAENNNTQAQFFWQNAYKKGKMSLVIAKMPFTGTLVLPTKVSPPLS